MHHKENNNIHSSDNHDKAQHKKVSNYPEGRLPSSHVKQREKGSGFLQKIRNKIKEPPATKEEIDQLKLNTQREELKTRSQLAKNRRPSRFAGIGGGGFGGGGGGRSGRTGHHSNDNSFLFGGGNSNGGSFLDMGSSPSLDFITGGNQKPSRRGRNNSDEGGISGKGLSDMFT